MRKRAQEPWETKLGTSNFDPIEAFEFGDALKSRQTNVKLSTGREFVLEYMEDNKVYYKTARGFGACGVLDIDHFLKGL